MKTRTVELSDNQLNVLRDFLTSTEYSFEFDNSEKQMYFSNDTNFRCSKTDYNSLKKAFLKVDAA